MEEEIWKMSSQWLKTLLLFSFVFVSFFVVDGGNVAEASSSLKQKLIEIEEKRNSNDQQTKETKKEIEKLEKEIKKVQEEMKELDEEITSTNEKMIEKEEEIEETEERIEKLKERIKELEERIEERDALLKERVRIMYQNGGSVNYLEVLLGAKSFGDFLDRVAALNTIAEQDKEILEAHIRDHEELEAAKEEVEEQLASLEENLAELEKLKKRLDKKQAEKQAILGDLEEEGDLLSDVLYSLEEEEELLKRQEEAARAELKAYEERTKAASSGSNASSSRSSNSVSSGSHAPSETGGTLLRPATGALTSPYGMRGGRMHHGIDIGQGGRSNVAIVAAESGTVVQAGWMNGYGNTVMISHNINGRQITTLYAHMSSIHVSVGQRVSRGQQIGIMGNTGASRGPHLHFEVHEGPWNGAKSNSVNPIKYL